jgi:hypothetical protein
MKSLRRIALVSVLFLSFVSANAQSRLHFPDNGFSITALEEASDDVGSQPITMYLPATEDFAPSVNVQIQPYDGTLSEYIDLSRQQFEEYGLDVADEKRSGEEVTWEYTGSLQERDLKWYARAIHTEGKVYVVTATALASQWTSVSDKLKSCVDSFKMDAKQ